MYIAIDTNQLPVDKQREDFLFQIFTSNILQGEVGYKAPFFVFIQRVCLEPIGTDGRPRKVEPGCGRYKIHNFLILFHSFEVTKAMLKATNARTNSTFSGCNYTQLKVDLFTN